MRRRLTLTGSTLRARSAEFKALLADEIHRTLWPRLAEGSALNRSEEHTSELQSLMRISYAVFCLKKKKLTRKNAQSNYTTTTLTYHYTQITTYSQTTNDTQQHQKN